MVQKQIKSFPPFEERISATKRRKEREVHIEVVRSLSNQIHLSTKTEILLS
jgi:hypothetical protein